MGTRASSLAKLARAAAGASDTSGGIKAPPRRQIPAASTDAAQLLERGLAAQQARNWALAISDFNAVLELEPDHPAALYSLAAIESNLGQPEAALPKIDRVIALKPGFAMALLARSTILRQLGQLNRALNDAELAFKLDPSMPDARQNRDRLLELQAKKPVTPTQVAADRLCQQGLALQTAGNITEASAFFVQALDLDKLAFRGVVLTGGHRKSAWGIRQSA